jgi:hypothetical protein
LRLRGREWIVSSYRSYSATTTAALPTDSSTISSCDSPSSSVAAVALESDVVVDLNDYYHNNPVQDRTDSDKPFCEEQASALQTVSVGIKAEDIGVLKEG